MYRKLILLAVVTLICSTHQAYASMQSHESLRTAASKFLQEEIKDIEDSEVTIRSFDRRLRLAKCSAPLQVFWPLEKKKFGNSTIGIRCSGDKPWKIYIGVYIHIYKNVWIAQNALSRGQIIAMDNISKERRDITKLTRGYLPAHTSIVGKQVKQNINAYQVLTDLMLDKQKLVSRGDRITIVSKLGNIVVQASGVALSDGSKGDRIRVKNMSSKREIEAYVSDKHRVLLNL